MLVHIFFVFFPRSAFEFMVDRTKSVLEIDGKFINVFFFFNFKKIMEMRGVLIQLLNHLGVDSLMNAANQVVVDIFNKSYKTMR